MELFFSVLGSRQAQFGIRCTYSELDAMMMMMINKFVSHSHIL